MRAAVAIALVVTCLSGCSGAVREGLPDQARGPCRDVQGPTMSSFRSGPDWSKETLWVNVSSPAAFAVAFPLPVSDEGTKLRDWLANATAPSGWRLTESNGSLRLDGNGSGSVALCSIMPAGQGDVAEAYLNAAWGASGIRPEALPVDVVAGPVDVSIGYRAGSMYCGAFAHFASEGLPAGRQSIPGEAQAICT